MNVFAGGAQTVDTGPGPNVSYRFGDFELESGSRTLRARATGDVVPLTPRAFDLLLVLLRRPNVPVGKRELIDALWPDTVVEDGNLDQAIFALRQALGEQRGAHRYIKTIHRRGYQFTEPVHVLGPSDAGRSEQPAIASPRWFRHPAFLAALVACAIGLLVWLWAPRAAPPANRRLAVLHIKGSGGESGQLLADSVTDLLEQRLAAMPALAVIGTDSTWIVRDAPASDETARRLTARFLLAGRVARQGDQLRLSLQLRDAESAETLWTRDFARPVVELGGLRDDVATQVAATLTVPPSVAAGAALAPVSLDAYELYERGMRLMGPNASIDDAETATALFTRTTSLDPEFARGYLAMGNGLIYVHDLKPHPTTVQSSDVAAEARRAIERALQLNPGLGEAWIAKARLDADPVAADREFRRGLELAPNYTVGAMFYSNFLSDNDRSGEALDVLDRARVLDPLSTLLMILQSQQIMSQRSDVDAAEHLARQAYALDPEFASGQLAGLLYQERGRFADAIRIGEQLHDETGGRAGLATLYLEVDDLDAALAVWNTPPAPFMLMVISQYRHDTRAAAELARGMIASGRVDLFDIAADSIRDEAVASGDYAAALALFEPAYAAHPWSGAMTVAVRRFGIDYAHTLILAGKQSQGRDLAREMLVGLDADEIGRPAHWYGRERAALCELLGDHDRAIEELAASQKLNHWSRWWYTGDIDPLYAQLRKDPRFQVLVRDARNQRSTQRALVEDMRRRGEIPRRGVGGS